MEAEEGMEESSRRNNETGRVSGCELLLRSSRKSIHLCNL
jgi:hypothetical protein